MGANAQTSVPAFTAGQVLTAAQMTQVNTGIPVFASSTERDAAFGGTGEKTLAEGQMAYLEDTNATQYYDGSSWAAVAGGKILQVVTGTLDTTASTSSSTFVDTGLTVSITPSSVSNKVAVFATPLIGKDSGTNAAAVTLLRNSTNLIVPDTPGSRTPAYSMLPGDMTRIENTMLPLSITWLDPPATTSATTYKVQYKTSGGNVYINRTATDTDTGAFSRGVSSIIAMEVSA